MKKLFFILTLILLAPACNKTDTVDPELQEDVQEMEEDKQKDPRQYDEDMERDVDRREVKREPTSTEDDKIIWTPANN